LRDAARRREKAPRASLQLCLLLTEREIQGCAPK
jgi:hypothetical protein